VPNEHGAWVNGKGEVGSPGYADIAPTVAITEVDPAGSSSSYGSDWFELTNYGVHPVDMSASAVTDTPAEVGSPGFADPGFTPIAVDLGLAITEVDPSGSNDSTYAADWFELTNTSTLPTDLDGWSMDDSSDTWGVGTDSAPITVAGDSP
jgi:hypothetical protein